MADESLQTEVAARIDSICQRFEAACQRGESPAIDDYLDQANADDREALREELHRVHAGILATLPIHEIVPPVDDGSTARPSAPSTAETQTRSDASHGGEGELPIIPGYVVIGRIARGGMGEVLAARHQALDRPVAIKLPLAKEIASDLDRERFLREARAAARLHHPHICTIYEIGEAAGRPYIAMDYIRGETLKQWREQQQPTARRAAEMVALLARAVDYAHSQGIVHRDIKPSNVIVEAASGSPILMDFGLAKQLEGDAIELTSSGQIMGTPAYMAPEQAAGHLHQVGPLTDVYAVGAVFYELLCGQPPFQGSVGEVLSRIQTDEPPRPRSFNEKIHRDAETICLKALAKVPSSRYGSAVALAEDLERFSAGEPVLAKRASLAVRLWRRAKRSPVTACLLALAVVAALASGVLSRKASGMLEASRLARAIETGLDDRDFTDQHLQRMESLVGQLDARAPSDALVARKRLYQKYGDVHLALLHQQSLEPELEARVLRAIDLLDDREPSLASTLRQTLEERRQIWDKIIEIGSDTSPDAVFETGMAARKDGKLLPATSDAAAGLAPATVLARAGSRGTIDIEAVFDSGWEHASQVGVVLNANAGHAAQIVSLAVSADGNRLVTGSLDRTAKCWNLRTGEPLATFRLADGIRDIAISPDGTLLATASHELRLWNLKTFTAAPPPREATGGPHRVAFLPEGRVLAMADPRAELKLLDLDTGALTVRAAARDGVAAVALASDGSCLAIALADGAVETWNVKTGKLYATCRGESPVNHLVLSHDGRRGAVVRGGPANAIQIFDVQTGEPISQTSTRSGISAICFSHQGALLAVAEWGGSVELRDVAHAETKTVLVNDGNYHAQIQSLAFTPDDSALVGGAVQSLCKVWDTKARLERATLSGSNYTFRLVGNNSSNVDQLAAAREPITLDEARQKNKGFILEIVRDGSRLCARELDARQVPAGNLRMVASRQDDHLTVQINDRPPLEFYDAFPLSRNRPGVFGLVWPPGAALIKLQARRKAPPAVPNDLERGDEAFSRGDLSEAAQAYRDASLASAGAATVQAAQFKSALCLTELGRTEEARQILGELASSEGDRWPVLAACQIWLQELRDKRFAEAHQIFEGLSARYGEGQLFQVVPSQLRDQILAGYGRQSRDFYLYAPDPSRVLNLERAVAVERMLGVPEGSFGSRWYLLRAYHAAGRFDDAIALAREALSGKSLGFGNAWAEEYAWLLSVRGEADKAIAFLNRLLVESPGTDHGSSHSLLLARARAYCILGRWEEAEHDVEAFFELEPAENLPDNSRPMPCLLRGFLRERRDDQAGAVAAWRQGLLFDRRRALNGSARLADIILASLVGELSDAEAEAIAAQLFSALAEGTPLAATKNLFRLPPAVIREAWRTPRGRAIARQIAFRQVPMTELVRLPAIVVAAEATRQMCFGGGFTADEEAVVWDLASRAFDAYAAGRLKTSHIIQCVMTLKGNTNFLGWQGLKPALTPDLRAPLAYVFGCRYLRLARPADGRAFFQTCLDDAPADSTLRRLAEARIQSLE
jgi:eukaryotic-like serine/threonine-protein kinase